jgi:hypothetical protein
MSNIEPPIKYEYHSWRLDAEVEEMGEIKATRYWRAEHPDGSSTDWYEEHRKFDTVAEAFEWVGEVVS